MFPPAEAGQFLLRQNEELRAELHALRLSFLPRHGPRRSASLKRLASRKLKAAKAAASELAGATGATLKFDFEVAASVASSAAADTGPTGETQRRRARALLEAAWARYTKLLQQNTQGTSNSDQRTESRRRGGRRRSRRPERAPLCRSVAGEATLIRLSCICFRQVAAYT